MTGTLKARVGSNWVPLLGSGFDAASTAKWNAAWGIIAEARWASTWSSTSTAAQIITSTSGSNTFTVFLYASRRYRLYWQGMVTSTAAADYVVLQHLINGAQHSENNAQYIPAANAQYFTWVESRYIPAADGNCTFAMTGRRSSASTGTVSVINTGNNPLWLMIEDLGPITPASIAPPAAQPRVVASGNALGVVAVGSAKGGSPTAIPANTWGNVTNDLPCFMAVGRRYRVHVQLRAVGGQGSAGGFEYRLSIDTNTPFGQRWTYIAGAYLDFQESWLIDGDGANHVLNAVINGGSAGINAYSDYNCEFYVEDVGPNTSPALPLPATDPPWTSLTLINGWLHYGAPYTLPTYRKIGDIVYVRGLLKSGTAGTSVAVLPVGFRPAYTQHHAAVANDALYTLRIQIDGNLFIGTQAAGAVWVSLDNHNFSTTA